MPARSLISSPSPAIASTVPALSVAASSRAKASIAKPPWRPRCSPEPPLWLHAQAAQHASARGSGSACRKPSSANSSNPWNTPVSDLGKPEARLRQLAADVEHAHQDAGEHHAHRVQPADEGHDDRREAVAGRHVRRELAERARDLERARQAGQRRPRSAARSTARGATRSPHSARRRAPGRPPAVEAARRCGTETATASAAATSAITTPMFSAKALASGAGSWSAQRR